MRFEFLEPTRSLQPNLASAETSGVIPLLKKISASAYIFFCKERRFDTLRGVKNALYVKKKKKFKDGKNRLERANQLATLKSL